MSKLEELINKLCPNGVEFQPLKNKGLFKFYYGKGNRIPEDIGGIYDVYGANGIVSHINEYNCEDVTIIGHIGAVGMVNRCKGKCFVTYNGTIAEVVDKTKVNSQYLYYVLTTLDLPSYKKGSQPFLSVSDFDKISIPVPPLEVQCEIVRILDNFTLLSAELSAELSARQKQYEYYENALLHNEYPMIKLEEVCNITSGGTPSKTKQEYWNNGTIKWLGSTVCKNKKFVDEVTGYITELGLQKSSAKLMKERTTLIAMVGATIGKVSFLNFEATTNQNVACLFPRDEEKLNPDYLYYACKNLYSKFIEFTNGKFAIASLSFIKELEIPIPSIEEQERIVNILDRFDKLCNDISEGLPAEIEARKKQYEYYRDKLLTFKELKDNE